VQLTLANASDIVFNRSNSLEIAHAITGAANSEIVQMGSGTLTLSGTADNATGNLRVENGTVVLAKTSSFNVHAAAVNVFLNNGTIRLGGTGDDQILNSSSMFVRNGTFDLNGKYEIVGRVEGSGGVITNTAAGTSAELRVGNGNANSAFTGTFIPGVIGATGTGGYGGVIQDGAGTVKLSKDGTGLVAVTGANTYSGGTEILAGDAAGREGRQHGNDWIRPGVPRRG
jgi:autotransporter-associated beta strand protein